jgi:hypothetical protein
LAVLFRKADKNRQASKYATTNQYEWFAENFTLYAMGRAELVDPLLIELVEKVFRGDY